jgi:hypothetical protein
LSKTKATKTNHAVIGRTSGLSFRLQNKVHYSPESPRHPRASAKQVLAVQKGTTREKVASVSKTDDGLFRRRPGLFQSKRVVDRNKHVTVPGKGGSRQTCETKNVTKVTQGEVLSPFFLTNRSSSSGFENIEWERMLEENVQK